MNIVKLRATAKVGHPVNAPTGRTRVGGADKSGGSGSGSSGNHESSPPNTPDGIKLPDIVEVVEGDANWVSHGFTDHTACKVIEDATGEDIENQQSVYTFYVNVDNVYLRTDMKGGRDDVALKKAKFKYANVLVGLALIHEWRSGHRNAAASGNGEDEHDSMEAAIEKTTRALAPFLVPMIDYLGALTSDEIAELARAGDEE